MKPKTFHKLLCLASLSFLVTVGPACVVIPIGDLLKGPPLVEQSLVDGAREKLVIIDVSGVITATESTSLLGGNANTVAEFKTRLDWAAQDSKVKAIVLRISSPGGEVTACDVIHHELTEFRSRTKIPVVACVQDMAASGGYYIACGADEIQAHPTSVIGSIGVILQSFDLSGLLNRLGVKVDPIKSSDKKDISSVFRPREPEESAILQKVVDDMYARFVSIVVTSRANMDEAKVKELADGRIVSGSEAKTLGLVDRLGYLDDAIQRAAELAEVDSPTVVRYTRRAQGGSNIYTQLDAAPPTSKRSSNTGASNIGAMLAEALVGLSSAPGSKARFYYLWTP